MPTKILVRLISTAVLLSISAFAVDGVVLINQNTVIAAGGFPYHFTQPGSYRLTGNLVVTTANIAAQNVKGAIEIDADNVTLDLNGFSISGPNTCTGVPASCTNNGVSAAGIFSSHSSIVIFNGSVQGMGDGVNLFGSDVRVEDVNATQNFGNGILIGRGIIRRCNASQNGFTGLADQGAGLIESNTVNFNGTAGILSHGGTVSGNTVDSNGGDGLIISRGIANNNSSVNSSQADLFLEPLGTSNHNNNCSGSVC